MGEDGDHPHVGHLSWTTAGFHNLLDGPDEENVFGRLVGWSAGWLARWNAETWYSSKAVRPPHPPNPYSPAEELEKRDIGRGEDETDGHVLRLGLQRWL